MDALPASLIRTESGGNFQARNDVQGSGGRGHFGRGQFSQGRLQDAMRAGVIPQGTTPQQFLADPNMQQRVEQWHVQDIMSRAERDGLTRHIGQTINGTPVTPEGMLAVAHLGGYGGLSKFLSSGGQYNPSDAFGTSLADYLRTHGQAAGGANALSMGEAVNTQQSAPQGRTDNALAQAQQAEAIQQRNALAMLDRAQVQALDIPQMDMPRMAQMQPIQARPFDTQAEYRPRSVRRT